MFIIGFPNTISNEHFLAFFDHFVPDLVYSSSSPSSLFRKPSPEISVLRQFREVLSTNNKFPLATVQPVPELYPRLSSLSSKHFSYHIGVDNRAHQ